LSERQLVSGVHEQMHRAPEIIVVDDGPADGTRALAKRLAAAVTRVAVLHQPNAAVAAACNAGWQRAHSALIAFIDAGDQRAPAKIERQLALLQPADVGIGVVCGGHSRIDEAGRIAVRPYSPLHERAVVEPITSSNFIGNGSSVLIRRDAFVAARGFDTGLRALSAQSCEDDLLYYRVAPSAASPEVRVKPVLRRGARRPVACHVEMGGEGRARRGAMQGAKHSDAQRHRKHLQRRGVPRFARTATSDFSVTAHQCGGRPQTQ
jgi:glycosyltransferase involved in cell wall biosynthesis